MEGELPALRAVIYVPAGAEATRHRLECQDHCRRRGYRVVAVAHTPAAVDTMWREDRMDRVVVARPEHLRQIAYAVEVVTDSGERRTPRQRRPRRVTRRDGGER